MEIVDVVACMFLLTACGGGGGGDAVTTVPATPVTFSATTLKVFTGEAGGAGVGRFVASAGGEMVMIAPNIVAEVAAASSIGIEGSTDISTYPIASVQSGYNVRTGVQSGYNLIIAEKVGTDKASIVYLYNGTTDAVATGSTRPLSYPSGNQSYTGVYAVGNRGSTWSEIGSASMTANFQNQTFSISATSTDTSLTGTGIIDIANGRISSNNLAFTDANLGNYTASTVGNVGSSSGQDITGVWYTNDTAPDFAGAYAVDR